MTDEAPRPQMNPTWISAGVALIVAAFSVAAVIVTMREQVRAHQDRDHLNLEARLDRLSQTERAEFDRTANLIMTIEDRLLGRLNRLEDVQTNRGVRAFEYLRHLHATVCATEADAGRRCRLAEPPEVP